jgi:hypothetical protein
VFNFLLETHYLPSVGYMALIEQASGLWLEAFENFQKQTFRNRCMIKGSNKVQMLTVPVKKAGGKWRIRDVKIDYSQAWISHHIRSFQSAYGKAPFYEFYADDLFDIIQKKITFLFDLNLELLTKCLDLLRINKNINLTDAFYYKPPNTGLIDLREVFCEKSSHVNRVEIDYKPYYQVFGKDFVENVSIVDLLFCEGPEALNILRQCKIALTE